LTLTGAGGSGKTRLALRVAEDLRTSFRDGAWWVELASVSGPDFVQRKVASTLGVAEVPGRETSELLVEYLEHRKVLLILDNCEHWWGRARP
jgi:predicted ATPase